jgi:hypothetical protein
MANRLEFEATMDAAGFRAGVIELEGLSQAAAVRINAAFQRASIAAGLQNRARSEAAELQKFSRGMRGAQEAAMDIGVLGASSTVFSASEKKTATQDYSDWWSATLLAADVQAASRSNQARSLWRNRGKERAEAELAGEIETASRSNQARSLWRNRGKERAEAELAGEIETASRSNQARALLRGRAEARAAARASELSLLTNVATMGGTSGSFGHGGGPGGGVSGVMRESLVIVRELGRGNLTRVPGSALLLAQYMGLLGKAVKSTAAEAILHAAAEDKLAASLSRTALVAEAKLARTLESAAASGLDAAATKQLAFADTQSANAARANAIAQIEKARAANVSADIQKAGAITTIGPLGLLVAALIATGAAAFFMYEHFKTLNEELDRTAKAAERGYGDMGRMVDEAMKKSADATADLVEWNKKLGASQETIADKTRGVIDALTEEYNLKKQLAKQQGASQQSLDALDQEERAQKLKIINDQIAAAQKARSDDKRAASDAVSAAFTGPDAVARNARIEDIPKQRADAEKKIEEAKKFLDDLQKKVDEADADAENAIRLANRDAIIGKSPEEMAKAIAEAKAANRAKLFSVGEKGQTQEHSLDEVNRAISQNEEFINTLKTDLPKLIEVQRELAAAVQDAKEAGNKDSESVKQLTQERDRLVASIGLHAKYDPLIAGKQSAGGIRGSQDSLVRVGNFLGSSRGQIETLAAEANRLAREHVGVSRRIEINTRPKPVAPGTAHYPTS